MSTSRATSNRAIPIVMDAGALSDASVKAASHDHADDPSQPLAGPAPVFVMVGDTPIDEAEIAREMQFHRADNPHDARQAAATTLVIRELVRRECERLQGFPDDYLWAGKRSSIARQIGNAVPPPLAAHIIAAALNKAGADATGEKLCEAMKAPYSGVLANYDFSADDMTGIPISSFIFSKLVGGMPAQDSIIQPISVQLVSAPTMSTSPCAKLISPMMPYTMV